MSNENQDIDYLALSHEEMLNMAEPAPQVPTPEVETEDEVEPATAAVAVEPSAEEPPRTKVFM